MFKKSTLSNRPLTLGVLFLCCFAAFSPFLLAADAAKVENRFLFLVDTSSAMSNLADGGYKAVQKLLASGIEGQLHEGDTLGVWTYNDKLHDEFPMQVWAESDKQRISDAILGYLRSRKCEKKAHLDRVLPSMYAVIQASRTLTVILVSDGTGEIKGTPFDKDINELHADYAKNLRSANVPFVTILASRNGAVFDYTINSAASNIRVPQTAEAVKTAVLPPATNPPPALPPVSVPVLAPKPEPRGIEIGSHTKPAPLIIAPAPVPAPAPEIKTQAVAPLASIELAASNPPTTAPAVGEDKKSPVPVPAKTDEVQKVAPVAPAAEEKPTQATTPVLPPVSNPPSLAAAQPVAQRDHSTRVLLGIACFLLAVFAAIITFLVFRLRRTSQTSLISQSMSVNKEKGPPGN